VIIRWWWHARSLRKFLDHAQWLLASDEVDAAKDYLGHGEHALAGEQIIDRLADHEIGIDPELAAATLIWWEKHKVRGDRNVFIHESLPK
jgi:hypothetical protein